MSMNYDKKLKAVGDKVVLEVIDKKSEKRVNGIIIPQKYTDLMRLSKARILSLGEEAKKRNIKVGDIVTFDYYSIFYDTTPTVVTKVENIISIEEE